MLRIQCASAYIYCITQNNQSLFSRWGNWGIKLKLFLGQHSDLAALPSSQSDGAHCVLPVRMCMNLGIQGLGITTHC